jgi:hypothetical protein
MQRDLAVRARQGDHDAFNALAASSIGRLFSIACLILRDRDRAEDATQEALVQAWRDIRGLRDPESLDPWLNRLLVRAAIGRPAVIDGEPSSSCAWCRRSNQASKATSYRSLSATRSTEGSHASISINAPFSFSTITSDCHSPM